MEAGHQVIYEEQLRLYKSIFAGGMLPFDDAYRLAKQQGCVPAECQTRGVYAVLDAFVKQISGGAMNQDRRPYTFELTWDKGQEIEEMPPDLSYRDVLWFAVQYAKRMDKPVTIIKHWDNHPNEPHPLLTVTAVKPDITKGLP